jgi:hypothetical protein
MKNVQVYDNDDKTFDRYSVMFGNDLVGMSHNPLSPQGLNQYGGTVTGDLSPLGKELDWEDVPEEIKDAIRIRLR